MAQKPKKLDMYRDKKFKTELANIQAEKFRKPRIPSHASLTSKPTVRGTKPIVGEIEQPSSNEEESSRGR